MKKSDSSIKRYGIVLPNVHPTDASLYLVNFGQKTTDGVDSINDGIWCINGLSPFTRFQDANGKDISYGSYTPLQPFTPVQVTTTAGGGNPTIVALAKTNTSIPDPKNRNDLHVVYQSPRGSKIAIDDKTGNVQIMHNQGEASIVLADDTISMELSTGTKSGKEANTFFTMSKGSFKMQMKDAVLKFDETGFYVGSDGDASYFKVSKDGIEIHGNEFVKTTAKETVSMFAKEATITGSKDASLRANHLRLSGTQLTNVTGAAIGIEAINNLQLKGMQIGIKAGMLHTIDSPNRLSKIPAQDVYQVGIHAEKSSLHTVSTSTWSLGASLIAADGMIVTNGGTGKSIASANFNSGFGTTSILDYDLAIYSTLMTTKTGAISASNKILTDTLAGTAKTAQQPQGSASQARDKNDNKTINSVIASSNMRTESVMKKHSIVPHQVAKANDSYKSTTKLTTEDYLNADDGMNLPFSKRNYTTEDYLNADDGMSLPFRK